MYLTFDEYQNMGGTLEETAFNELEFEAEAIINYRTFDRLKNDTEYPEAVKMCVYKLIKIAQVQQQAFSLGQDVDGEVKSAIASQSNDGVSISYNAMSASDAYEQAEKQVNRCVETYLQGVTNELGRKLLYRGIYPNE
jgi:hypothetical protein